MLIRMQTKKILMCTAVLILAAALISCGKKKTEEFTFRATITEIRNGSMLVMPVEGSDELRSSDSFRVKIENMPSAPEPEVGDVVEITYDGGIQETYPAGLDHVFDIIVVEKAAKTDGSAPGSEAVTDDEEPDDGQQKAFVRGPYGEISVDVPSGWSVRACHVDEEGMMYGLYGFILKPDSASDGQIELFCSDSFGVCGTGLVQEDITLAGGKATVGTYDEHKNWDYIVFGEGDLQKTKARIIAQHTECVSWTEEMWEEALLVLDTMHFDPAKTEGGVGQYIPESENDEIAVSMEALHVVPSGCIVRFRQYDRRDTGELIYGKGFMLEKKDGDSWEAVPMIIDDAVFTDEGYTIPPEGESEIETDWNWLYGVLDPGTYRIRKMVTDHRDSGNKEYALYAQFLIA